MTRSAKLLLTLALTAVAIPGAVRAQAQEPKDNKYTKEASKFLTVAELKQAPAEKAGLYQQALASLLEAMNNPKEASNAKVWYYAGQAYASLGKVDSADMAFRKAESLYPGFKNDIDAAREKAWLSLFKQGADVLDKNQPDSATALMLAAEKIYDQRPEAALNLGVIYLNAQKYDDAEKELLAAKARLKGPLYAKLKPEDQALWNNWGQLIDNLRGQIESNKGILAFRTDDYDAAITAFSKAFEINPVSRDHVYNLAESVFAKSARLERQRGAVEDSLQAEAQKKKPSKPAMESLTQRMRTVDTQLAPVWDQLIDAANKLLPFEPANSDVYIMLAKAYRGQSLAATTAASKKELEDKALAALNKGDALPFEVRDPSAQYGDSSKVSGTIKNRKGKAGDPAKIHVTFLSLDGATLGETDVSVQLGAPDVSVPFEAKAATKGQVSGWKYTVVN